MNPHDVMMRSAKVCGSIANSARARFNVFFIDEDHHLKAVVLN